MHTVHGDSMYPLLRSGQRVLVNRFAYRISPPAVDDILVFRRPDSRVLMVKRVTAITAGPRYELRGDNAGESFDSRHFGVLEGAAIIGRVEFLDRSR